MLMLIHKYLKQKTMSPESNTPQHLETSNIPALPAGFEIPQLEPDNEPSGIPREALGISAQPRRSTESYGREVQGKAQDAATEKRLSSRQQIGVTEVPSPQAEVTVVRTAEQPQEIAKLTSYALRAATGSEALLNHEPPQNPVIGYTPETYAGDLSSSAPSNLPQRRR